MYLIVSAVLSAVATVTLAVDGNIAVTQGSPSLCVVPAQMPAGDGTPVVLGRCVEANSPWNYDVNTKKFKLFSNQCLDVKDGANQNGNTLQTWTCFPGDNNQQFEFISPFTIRWIGTTKCIDVKDGIYQPGTPLQIWDCATGDNNQVFSFPSAPQPLNFKTSAHPEFCVTASSNNNGAPLTISTCNNTPGQCFTPADGGYHAFNNTLAIDLTNGQQTNGNKLQVWQSVPGDQNQQWVYSSITGNLKLAVNQNKCIDVTNGNFTSGAPLQIWDCFSGDVNQQFTAAPCA